MAAEREAMLAAARAKARALAGRLAPAEVPTGAHDCSEDLSCFVERAKRCEYTAVRHVVGSIFGSSVIDVVVGADRDGELCQYSWRVVAFELPPPTDHIAAQVQNTAGDKTNAQQPFDQMKKGGEDRLTCYYPRAELDEVLGNLVAGVPLMTTKDPWDWEHCYRGNGECTASLAAGCTRVGCERGRLTFQCQRAGDAERCTTQGWASRVASGKLNCIGGEVMRE